MRTERPLVVVGNGWLGRAIDAEAPDSIHVAQRRFDAACVPSQATIIVASGWSSLPGELAASRTRSELDDVVEVLDVARRRDARVVVVGSSDVCGLADTVNGRTPVAPVTAYGHLKAHREALVAEARGSGVDATAVRLGPTHGPGKSQTARLVELASGVVVPLPRGGRYSVGFVTLADAVEALLWLAEHPAPAVASVGAGPTELRLLISEISRCEGGSCRIVPIPMPRAAARRMATSRHDRIAWLGRFSLPRTVEMEPEVAPMPIDVAARYLVSSSTGEPRRPRHLLPRRRRAES